MDNLKKFFYILLNVDKRNFPENYDEHLKRRKLEDYTNKISPCQCHPERWCEICRKFYNVIQ